MTEEYHSVISERNDELAEMLTEKTYAAHEDLFRRFGTPRRKVKEYITHHLTYLSLAVELENPEFFGDYWAWNRSVLEGRKVPMDELKAFLPLFQRELKQDISTRYHDAIDAAIEAAMEVMKRDSVSPPSFLEPEAPHAPLAQKYLQLLLDTDRRQAADLIQQAVAEGVRIEDLYLHVFQPVQWEIGRLWQVNEIGVAQEHYATAVTQMVMSALYPKIFSTEKHGKTLVAACVGNELHEIGIRMVADLFELSGWETSYLGANTPRFALHEAVESHGADLLALSLASIKYFSEMKSIIESVKSEFGSELKVMVGGYAFNTLPDMWRRIGADAWAANAVNAVKTADEMVPSAKRMP